MPLTVRLYLTISSIRVEKVRVGKLPRNWAVGWVTGSPAWTPWSGTKWVSLTQLLPKVKFSSLPIPKKKGNIYLFHILFFSSPKLNQGGGVLPIGCSHDDSTAVLSTNLWVYFSHSTYSHGFPKPRMLLAKILQIRLKCHLSPKAVSSSPNPIALFLQCSCFKMYLANEWMTKILLALGKLIV